MTLAEKKPMPSLRTLWKPALYHGRGARPPFFEGWYFKLVDASEQHRYAVIPGVFIGREPGIVACVRADAGRRDRADRLSSLPVRGVPGRRDEFDIRVGPNRFRLDRIELDIDRPEGRMRGELRFAGVAPWPVTRTSPGIMGPYTFAPFMECYHGVLSFDHSIAGSLAVDGRELDFTGGRGYIEKDWGQAFPKAWIWMQSNHFGADARGAPDHVTDRIGGDHPVAARRVPRLHRRAAARRPALPLCHLHRRGIERLDLADTHVTWHMSRPRGPRTRPTAWRSSPGGPKAGCCTRPSGLRCCSGCWRA